MLDDLIENTPSLPRYAEGGYSPLGRAPVVDVLLADPFYMPIYAEKVATAINKKSHLNSLLSMVTALQTAGGIPTTSLSKGKTLKESEEIPELFLQTFGELGHRVYSYWLTFLHVNKEVEAILKPLSKEEKSWIRQNFEGFFFGEQKANDYEFFTSESSLHLKFFELASRIDIAKLTDYARKLAILVDDLFLSKDLFTHLKLEEDFIWEENHLKFVITPRSHAEIHENADFMIDLGGHNTIYTNAGGTEGIRSTALHIDIQGHNTFIGKNFVQGSGFLGVGIMASFSGYNTFEAHAYSQGCGYFGVGIQMNYEGKNRYSLNFGGQSFALFGFSLLWNQKGNNDYLAKQGMAQAASSTLGVAFHIDNQGENTYSCGVSGRGGEKNGGIGQGGSVGVRHFPWLSNPSFYGGVAFLYNGGDDNTFKNVWLAQGSSYFLGAGILVAEGSNNTFEADYDAQGQGLHLSAGLLLKKGSQCQFNGGWGSLGVGADRSVGMFISTGGKNTYRGTDQSIGTARKPKSLGVFIDTAGQNSYFFKKMSNANVQKPRSPMQWPVALFMDRGGGSSFPDKVDEFVRGNYLKWGIANYSLGTVEEQPMTFEELFARFHETPRVPFPFDPNNGWKSNKAYKPLKKGKKQNLEELTHEILTADYDRRRQIYEILDLFRFTDRATQYDIAHFFQDPSNLTEDQFNFAALWALRNGKKVDLMETRSALRQGLFSSQYARKMAVTLLGIFWSPEAVPVLEQLMQQDPSEEIRYYAALILARHMTTDTLDILRKGLEQDEESTRYAIAKGLTENTNPYVLDLILPLLNDPSFYVKRAAAITAISLRDKRGIPVLLDTLQYETLDTEDNYGDNIYKLLSNYVGVDLGLDKEAWHIWWNEVRDEFTFPKGF